MSPTPPAVGQEQTLLALSVAMLRALGVAALATGIPAVAVAGVVAGVPGAISALAAAVLVVLVSLFTLWLMRRTAAREPRAVMMAIFGGYIQKMIFLLLGLFGLGAVDGVHRMSLALTALVMLIAISGAEGYAGYRLRAVVVDPDAVPATSGSATGLSDSGPQGATGDDAGAGLGRTRTDPGP